MRNDNISELDENVLQEVTGGRSILDAPDYSKYKEAHGLGEDWEEPGVGHLYRINHGDSLAKIGQAFGVHWRLILLGNRQIRNPNLIYVGDVIKIPF